MINYVAGSIVLVMFGNTRHTNKLSHVLNVVSPYMFVLPHNKLGSTISAYTITTRINRIIRLNRTIEFLIFKYI